MADYNSSYTGEQIDTAVGKALNPDTTPTASSNSLITSGGVKSALNDVEEELTSIDITGSTNNTGEKINNGTIFRLNGALVKAKTDIANGATLTSGTNYEAVSDGGFNVLPTALYSSFSTTDNGGTNYYTTGNGYCKFPDGTLVQWGTVYTSPVNPRAWGNVYMADIDAFAFPLAFVDYPTILVSQTFDKASCTPCTVVPSKTGVVKMQVIRGSAFANGAEITFSWLAIGKWK